MLICLLGQGLELLRQSVSGPAPRQSPCAAAQPPPGQGSSSEGRGARAGGGGAARDSSEGGVTMPGGVQGAQRSPVPCMPAE